MTEPKIFWSPTRRGKAVRSTTITGVGEFHDATQEFDLTRPSFLSTGFGVGWFDYDNDGWLDIFSANGSVTLYASLRGAAYPFHQRNQLFHNEGLGKGFAMRLAQRRGRPYNFPR